MRWNGREAEVVEEVVAQLEVGELGARHEQQQGLERDVALAQRPAEGERRLGVARRRTTMAPAQPSSGSMRVADVRRWPTAFHG